MNGGTEADVFQFNATSDGSAVKANFEVIADLVGLNDTGDQRGKIDMSAARGPIWKPCS